MSRHFVLNLDRVEIRCMWSGAFCLVSCTCTVLIAIDNDKDPPVSLLQLTPRYSFQRFDQQNA